MWGIVAGAVGIDVVVLLLLKLVRIWAPLFRLLLVVGTEKLKAVVWDSMADCDRMCWRFGELRALGRRWCEAEEAFSDDECRRSIALLVDLLRVCPGSCGLTGSISDDVEISVYMEI